MKSGSEIAKNEGHHHSVVSELMHLMLLALEIIHEHLSGNQDKSALKMLNRYGINLDWVLQRHQPQNSLLHGGDRCF